MGLGILQMLDFSNNLSKHHRLAMCTPLPQNFVIGTLKYPRAESIVILILTDVIRMKCMFSKIRGKKINHVS